MRYKREEYFRYLFEEPIPLRFRIEKVNGHVIESRKGGGTILDLSPGGMKFCSELMIADPCRNDIELAVYFTLNDEAWYIACRVVWAQEVNGVIEYGVEFLPDQNIGEQLVSQLKLYARTNRK